MARGVDGRDIFIDDVDRTGFLSSLDRINLETGASILAYCLMGNHFHLAIKVGAVPLSSIMQRILTGYSITFNHRHDRTGHLFQARYKAILCLEDAYLIGLIRYIHLNPVRAGLVSRPADWIWSSHLKYQMEGRGGLIPTDTDLPDFDPQPAPFEEVRPALNRILTGEKRELSSFAMPIALKTGISTDELRSGSRRRDVVAARRRFVDEAVLAGHPMITIARWLGLTPGALTRYMRGNNARKYKPDTEKPGGGPGS